MAKESIEVTEMDSGVGEGSENKVLEVKGLYKSFQKHFWSRGKEVLKGLDFFIPKGSVTGFLGVNGSGKTTAFKCLLQLLKKDKGEIRFFGQSAFDSFIQSRIGFLPEQPRFFEELSLEELLLFYGQLTHPFKKEALKKRTDSLMERAGLWENRFQKLKIFSKGMLQKVGLIQCFVSDPDLVLLDEPFSGLDPEGRHYVASLIEEMRCQGKSVFFSSHILPEVEKLCDRLVIIREGQIVFQGEVEKFSGRTGEIRRVVFLEKGKKKSLGGLNFSQCQKEVERLIREKCEILSVEPEYQNLEAAYSQVGLLSSED